MASRRNPMARNHGSDLERLPRTPDRKNGIRRVPRLGARRRRAAHDARRVPPAGPRSSEAIGRTAAEYEPSEFLLRILNYELNAVVRAIASRIPEEQREKLADAMKAANREASGR